MSDIVDEIKSRCNIVDVVSKYVNLKRTGISYKGLCPFHNEKTPSFNVNETHGYFKCFGCGESGDVISFLEKIENIDFITAISKLADEYGVDLSNFGYGNNEKQKRIYEINRETARFYFKNLTQCENPGYDYIVERDIKPETVKAFGLGFAKNDWHSLMDYLISKGYGVEELEFAGVLSNSKGRYYDKFRNRVIFPIINTRGKVIGFGGRDLGNLGPKYLNSPETAAFSKQNNLFGLNLTRNEISKLDYAIVVEGYMDLVSLYQNGVKNVVATLGTALTINQCVMLKRYTHNIILSYDADIAGVKAAIRGVKLLRNSDLKGRVINIPDGKDPDDFIKKYGKSAFLNLVDEALPVGDYLISIAKKKYDITSFEGSNAFLNELMDLLVDFDAIEVDMYIKKISQDTGISEGAIRNKFNEVKEKKVNNNSHISDISNTKKQTKKFLNIGNRAVQRNFISLIANNCKYLPLIKPYEFAFMEPIYLRIYSTVKDIYEEDSKADINKIMDTLGPEDVLIIRQILDSVLIGDNGDVILNDCKKKLEEDELHIRLKECINKLNFLIDQDQIRKTQDEINQIQRDLDKIKKSYGA